MPLACHWLAGLATGEGMRGVRAVAPALWWPSGLWAAVYQEDGRSCRAVWPWPFGPVHHSPVQCPSVRCGPGRLALCIIALCSAPVQCPSVQCGPLCSVALP